MSSPQSLPPLQSAEGLEAFSAALVQVAEDSLFAWAEPCDEARFAAVVAERGAAEPWLAAAVPFAGPFDGEALLALPRAAAADLCASFSGTPADELDEAQVVDFAGELANMACGLWLTRTHRTERFDLAAPRVGAVVAAAAGERGPGAASALLLNDAPVRIALRPADWLGRS